MVYKHLQNIECNVQEYTLKVYLMNSLELQVFSEWVI